MPELHPEYDGMTTNERLFVAGLTDEFDSAIELNDRQSAIDILCRVNLDSVNAGSVVDTIYANPTKYGYPRTRH
jgi:hypothetical protein